MFGWKTVYLNMVTIYNEGSKAKTASDLDDRVDADRDGQVSRLCAALTGEIGYTLSKP